MEMVFVDVVTHRAIPESGIKEALEAGHTVLALDGVEDPKMVSTIACTASHAASVDEIFAAVATGMHSASLFQVSCVMLPESLTTDEGDHYVGADADEVISLMKRWFDDDLGDGS